MVKLYTIVDRKDNVLRYVQKSETNNKDIYRVSGVLIYNSNHEVLLAKRASTKKHDAGKWGLSAVGMVEKGETYKQNAVKETQEELGITLDQKKLNKGFKRFFTVNYVFFFQLFYYHLETVQTEFHIDKREVEEIGWFKPAEVVLEYRKNPKKFVLNTASICGEFLRNFS